MKIYKLVKDGEVIYIGRTKLNLNRRKNSNFYKIPKEVSKLCDIELIEETDDKGRERFWIDYYLNLGYNLLNKRGGDFTSSNEAYEQRKSRMKEKRGFKPKTKEQIREAQKEYAKKYYELNREEINRVRKEKYANGEGWYHRKKQTTKIFV